MPYENPRVSKIFSKYKPPNKNWNGMTSNAWLCDVYNIWVIFNVSLSASHEYNPRSYWSSRPHKLLNNMGHFHCP